MLTKENFGTHPSLPKARVRDLKTSLSNSRSLQLLRPGLLDVISVQEKKRLGTYVADLHVRVGW